MKRPMLLATALSILGVLSWWRASQGLAGWTEMSVIWLIAAIVSWVIHWRARRQQGARYPPSNQRMHPTGLGVTASPKVPPSAAPHAQPFLMSAGDTRSVGLQLAGLKPTRRERQA